MEEIYKIGDKVWFIRQGWGEVTTLATGVYPVVVEFENEESFTFTKDGKFSIDDLYPTLFFKEIEIPKETLERPRWRAEKGESYYCVDGLGQVKMYLDYRNKWDDTLFKFKNYFQTKEEAIESKYYKVFHE